MIPKLIKASFKLKDVGHKLTDEGILSFLIAIIIL